MSLTRPCLFLVLGSLALAGCRGRGVSPHENELRELAEKVISAQERYAFANGGYFDSNLECLVTPARCIPEYEGDPASFLPAEQAALAPRHHHRLTLHTSAPLDPAAILEARVSPTSVEEVAYTVVPQRRKTRTLCADLEWMCYGLRGLMPPIQDGRCPRAAAGPGFTCIGITAPPSERRTLRHLRREPRAAIHQSPEAPPPPNDPPPPENPPPPPPE